MSYYPPGSQQNPSGQLPQQMAYSGIHPNMQLNQGQLNQIQGQMQEQPPPPPIMIMPQMPNQMSNQMPNQMPNPMTSQMGHGMHGMVNPMQQIPPPMQQPQQIPQMNSSYMQGEQQPMMVSQYSADSHISHPQSITKDKGAPPSNISGIRLPLPDQNYLHPLMKKKYAIAEKRRAHDKNLYELNNKLEESRWQCELSKKQLEYVENTIKSIDTRVEKLKKSFS